MSTYGPITVSGTTICLIPLTTAWSAASACQSLFLDNQIQSTGASAFQLFAYDGKYAAVAGGGPTCLPPDVSRWWSQSTNSQTAVVTQLGGYNFHCPEAYTTVFSLDPNIEMTTIGCCPSAYTYNTLSGAWILFRRRRQPYTVPPENTIFERHEGPPVVMEQPGFELGQRKEQNYDPPASAPQEQYKYYQPPAMELEALPHTSELA